MDPESLDNSDCNPAESSPASDLASDLGSGPGSDYTTSFKG